MGEGELKKRIEQHRQTANAIKSFEQDDEVIYAEEMKLWIEEARKEFPMPTKGHFNKENPTTEEMKNDIMYMLKIDSKRWDWFVKWFGDEEK